MNISHLAWEHLLISQEELKNVARERGIAQPTATMTQLQISGRKWMDGWMDSIKVYQVILKL